MSEQLTTDIEQYLGMAKLRKHAQAVRIYAEGDSWFDYFNCDVLTEICSQAKATNKPLILKKARGGDEAAQIFSGAQRHELVRDFTRLVQRHAAPELIMLSAGGNDLVGQYDFPLLVKKAAPGSPVDDFINQPALQLRLQQIGCGYTELAYLRDSFFPGVPIVTHQYDWAIPSDKGVRILGIKVIDSWMKPHMDSIGIGDADQKKIAHRLLEQFSATLAALQQGTFSIAGKPIRLEQFHIAPTQGTLSASEWANEIHPTEAGFAKIGAKVLDTIRGISPALAARI